jgi:hypothetical protein
MAKLTIPKDGPRVAPREPEQVSAYVRAELHKATEVWGMPTHYVRTLACHPMLAKAAIDYANAFVFQERVYAEVPRPGRPSETVLFPEAGFIDRVTKELVITLVGLVNRSRYSITHNGVISFRALSAALPNPTPSERERRAESMLLHLVDGQGQPSFEDRSYGDAPLYSSLQLAAFRLALKTNRAPHDVTDDEMTALRVLLREDAIRQIADGPLALSFGDADPDEPYLSAFVDAMVVELTWTIAHFAGLLNRWFTLLKLRDEAFAIAPEGASFLDAYDALPESLKARNNALLGADGWGQSCSP